MDRKTQLERELQRMTELIVRDYRPEQVILFGSLVHGTVHAWSDIDLAVVKDTPRRFLDRISDIFQLVHPIIALNVVYTPQEVAQMRQEDHSFWVEEISGKGKVLYDRAA